METFDDEIVAKSLDFLDRKAKDRSPSSFGTAPPACMCSSTLRSRSGKSRAGREDVYGDALAEHDGHVGQLLDKLDETGLDKNTIVVYSPTTAPISTCGQKAARGRSEATRAPPGRAACGPVHDPLAGSSRGRVSSEIVDMTDLLPTLAAAAANPMSSKN